VPHIHPSSQLPNTFANQSTNPDIYSSNNASITHPPCNMSTQDIDGDLNHVESQNGKGEQEGAAVHGMVQSLYYLYNFYQNASTHRSYYTSLIENQHSGNLFSYSKKMLRILIKRLMRIVDMIFQLHQKIITFGIDALNSTSLDHIKLIAQNISKRTIFLPEKSPSVSSISPPPPDLADLMLYSPFLELHKQFLDIYYLLTNCLEYGLQKSQFSLFSVLNPHLSTQISNSFHSYPPNTGKTHHINSQLNTIRVFIDNGLVQQIDSVSKIAYFEKIIPLETILKMTDRVLYGFYDIITVSGPRPQTVGHGQTGSDISFQNPNSIFNNCDNFDNSFNNDSIPVLSMSFSHMSVSQLATFGRSDHTNSLNSSSNKQNHRKYDEEGDEGQIWDDWNDSFDDPTGGDEGFEDATKGLFSNGSVGPIPSDPPEIGAIYKNKLVLRHCPHVRQYLSLNRLGADFGTSDWEFDCKDGNQTHNLRPKKSKTVNDSKPTNHKSTYLLRSSLINPLGLSMSKLSSFTPDSMGIHSRINKAISSFRDRYSTRCPPSTQEDNLLETIKKDVVNVLEGVWGWKFAREFQDGKLERGNFFHNYSHKIPHKILDLVFQLKNIRSFEGLVNHLIELHIANILPLYSHIILPCAKDSKPLIINRDEYVHKYQQSLYTFLDLFGIVWDDLYLNNPTGAKFTYKFSNFGLGNHSLKVTTSDIIAYNNALSVSKIDNSGSLFDGIEQNELCQIRHFRADNSEDSQHNALAQNMTLHSSISEQQSQTNSCFNSQNFIAGSKPRDLNHLHLNSYHPINNSPVGIDHHGGYKALSPVNYNLSSQNPSLNSFSPPQSNLNFPPIQNTFSDNQYLNQHHYTNTTPQRDALLPQCNDTIQENGYEVINDKPHCFGSKLGPFIGNSPPLLPTLTTSSIGFSSFRNLGRDFGGGNDGEDSRNGRIAMEGFGNDDSYMKMNKERVEITPSNQCREAGTKPVIDDQFENLFLESNLLEVCPRLIMPKKESAVGKKGKNGRKAKTRKKNQNTKPPKRVFVEKTLDLLFNRAQSSPKSNTNEFDQLLSSHAINKYCRYLVFNDSKTESKKK
jgi:hypothetical protein